MRCKVLLKIKFYYSREFDANNIYDKKSQIQNIADNLEQKLLQNKNIECVRIEQVGSRELLEEGE